MRKTSVIYCAPSAPIVRMIALFSVVSIVWSFVNFQVRDRAQSKLYSQYKDINRSISESWHEVKTLMTPGMLALWNESTI